MNSVLFSFLTFLAGLLLGNRLAIGRDRRREFNEVAQNIRAVLIKERERPTPYDVSPDSVDLDLFAQMLPFWKRGGFRRAVDSYRGSKKEGTSQDSVGGAFYRDVADIERQIDRVLRYTKRK